MARLRLGILARSVTSLSPWEVRLFDGICSDERFELVVVLTGAFDVPTVAQPWSALSNRLVEFDTARLARVQHYVGPAFEKALTKAKVWPVTVGPESASGPADDRTIASVSKLALDVLLVHGLDDFAGPLSSHARYGAWALRHAGQRLQTTQPDQVMACLELTDYIRVSLHVTANSGAATRPLVSAAFNLEKSPATTLARAAEKSVSLVLRELHKLHATGKLDFKPLTDSPAKLQASAPTALRYGRALAGVASGKITKTLAQRAGRLPLRWSLFFGEGEFQPNMLANTIEAPSADSEFWADPFLFQKDGETFVFFENYVYGKGLGKISVGIYRDGRLHVLGDALDLPYHVSFPFVFEHGGELYMMPETCGAKRVEVWRAVDFPLKWERCATALEGRSVADPVLLHDAGRWWLFANISETPFEDHCNELHVFEVDGPALKNMTPHPLNPVVIGADTARNGGRIVRRDGRLLRMSQNNSHGVYGFGLNIMEITILDEERYEESFVLSITPTFKPGLMGCHHMDQGEGLFVIDGCRKFG